MRNAGIIVFLFVCGSLFAQMPRKMTCTEYIEKYRGLAMSEMKRTGIPASIILAQGLLESGNGNSTLAVKANNHFGIKCHDWDGPGIYMDDDKKNECFRKYKTVEHSYRDHSDFLMNRNRYADLFDLKPDDYKGWAHGLKNAGYATSPTYAKALIKVIEENELYKYDEQVLNSTKGLGKGRKLNESRNIVSGRQIFYNNRVKYIIADSNDTYSKISEQLHLMGWQLPRYNEASGEEKLKKGDFVYLQPKRNRAAIGNKVHIVAEGETMHSISQLFGVKEQKLRERNNIGQDEEPQVGAAILLRGKLKNPAPSVKVTDKSKKQKKDNNSDDGDDSEFNIEYDLGD